MIRPDDIVRVLNHDARPVRVKWNSREYVLPAGKESFIPASCAFLYWGDPRSGPKYQSITSEDGTVFFVSDRATEVRRLRIKWGGQLTGDENSLDDLDIPKVEVFTAEGERLTTVVDDPRGTTVTPATQTQADDASLRALIASQQRQIEMLRQHLNISEEGEAAATSEAELPQDGNELRTLDVGTPR